MATISLASAHRTVALTRILDYIITTNVKRAFYDIPGKTAPTIDADTFVIKPTEYSIVAHVNDTDKATLILMRGDIDHGFTIVDDAQPYRNVDLVTMEFKINTGHDSTSETKWTVTIVLTGRDH
jgi:hypothetical protein